MIQGSMGMIYGMPVITSPHIPRFKLVQHRKPKSKSKRIHKKWAKDQSNFKQVPITSVYVVDNKVIMHPEIMKQLHTEYPSMIRR